MTELQGRVALITGGGRGIGAGIARSLGAAGAKVIVSDIVAPRDLAAEIGGWARALDVTDERAWASTMAFVRDEVGGLDLIVNNAGVLATQTIASMSLEEWRRVFSVNVEGVFLGCKYAVPLLGTPSSRRAAGGTIINISSIAAARGTAGMSAYSSSKAAVSLLTKCLSLELRDLGIRVNAILPGLIETDMGRQLIGHVTPDESQVNTNSEHTRLVGAGIPEDIGDAVVFLASDRSTFIKGSEIVIGGGQTA